MQKLFYYFVLFSFFVLSTKAQLYFQEGYFIDNENNKVECLILNKDWTNSPANFSYKMTEDSTVETKAVKDASEFMVYGTDQYYKRYTLKENLIDLSSVIIKRKDQVVYLKVLFESEKSLYAYQQKADFFFYGDDGDLTLLEYSEKVKNSKNIEGREYQKQLYEHFFCKDFDIRRYSELKYNEAKLVQFFEEYSSCVNEKFDNFYDERTKTSVVFNLTLGVNYLRNITTKGAYNENRQQIYIDENNLRSQVGYSFGLEAEFSLTNNRDKWRIYFAPNYQQLKASNSGDYNPAPNLYPNLSIPYSVSFDASALQLPVGIRRYFDINKDFELFVSSAYAFNVALKDDYDLIKPGVTNRLPIKDYNSVHKYSIIVGVGGTYKQKYSFRVNYYFVKKQAIDNFIELNAGGTLNFVAAYTLF